MNKAVFVEEVNASGSLDEKVEGFIF